MVYIERCVTLTELMIVVFYILLSISRHDMRIIFGYRGVIFDDRGMQYSCFIHWRFSNSGKTPINETRIFAYHDHQKLLHDTQKLLSYRGVIEGE